VGSLAALALACLPGGGCSSAGKEDQAARPEIRVAERDFKITAPRRPVRAGDVSLSVHNKGPDSHELIVVRKQRGELPLRQDGQTVDEDALERSTAGALEPQKPGGHRLRVHLAPGRYELFCNMSGHYLGGMEADLVVQ
jgi:uncharacterized cupredoxin-like copper-binding protein